MSWRTPVALEGVHDFAYNAFLANTALMYLAFVIYGILTPFIPSLDDAFASFHLALLILVVAPLILYHIAVVCYHLWNLGDLACFKTAYLAKRLYHAVALWHLRRTAFVRKAIGEQCRMIQELARNVFFLAVYRLPPFCYASALWTSSPSRRTWISRAGCNALTAETCTTSQICENCHVLTRGSALLLGSLWPLVRRQEEHYLGMTLAALETSASGKLCHLCTVLWSSMSTIEQIEAKKLESTSVLAKRSIQNNAGDAERQPLLFPAGAALNLVIWKLKKVGADGQGLLYMQLALSTIRLGERILVEEDCQSSQERELSLSTDSALCLEMARNWLNDCKSNHPKCRSREGSGRAMPSRLIHIQGNGDVGSDIRARLVQTESWTQGVDYLALSHCWGSTVKSTLTDHNHSELCQDIDLSTLSKNFIDAVHFTRKLGFSYLWIDSLCIMQRCFDHDSASRCNQQSLRDWESESREMANVYAQAYCTISATGSEESSGGCFKRRNPLPHFPCHILLDPMGQRSLTVRAANTSFKTNMFLAEVDGGPLSSRAWAFQERLLSQRVVHFGASLMFFECSTLFVSELQPEGIYDGVDVLTRDGARHEYPDLDRWTQMLSPFLPPPTPPPAEPVEPEEFFPPDHPHPSRPSSSLTLPKYYGGVTSKHARQKRARYDKAWNLFRDRNRHRVEEEAANERRHAARERARQVLADQEHLRKSERAAQAPQAPNPAFKPPEVVASISDNSVTGFRGAFDFLAAAAVSSHSIQPRDQLRLHQRWYELVGKYTRSRLTVASDRHMAAAGVAKAIQGPGAGSDYLAGLWRRHLEFDLLWSLEGLPRPRPAEYRAPSWSWISIDGEVSQQLLPFTLANEARRCDIEMMAKIVYANVLAKQSEENVVDATTPIGGGWLDLRGDLSPVLQINVDKTTGRGRLQLATSWADCILDALTTETPAAAPRDLFCLPILSMRRLALSPKEAQAGLGRHSSHGIILSASDSQDNTKHKRLGTKLYRRVGTFVVWISEGRTPPEDELPALEHGPMDNFITII